MLTNAARLDAVNYDATYHSVEHALREAYQCESQAIVKISSYFSQLRGGTVKLKKGSDQFDQHAQAAIVLSLLHRHVPYDELVVVQCRHTVPSTPMLEARKRADLELIYRLAITDRQEMQNVPKWYGRDVVMGWAGYPRQHDDDWWADNLKTTARTLRFWRRGRPERDLIGFVQLLDIAYENAVAKLREPMFEAGLTVE